MLRLYMNKYYLESSPMEAGVITGAIAFGFGAESSGLTGGIIAGSNAAIFGIAAWIAADKPDITQYHLH